MLEEGLKLEFICCIFSPLKHCDRVSVRSQNLLKILSNEISTTHEFHISGEYQITKHVQDKQRRVNLHITET